MAKITLQIEFSEEDAITLFRSNNIKVNEVDVPGLFGSMGKGYKVENPSNGYTYPLDKAFRAVMDQRVRRVMLQETDKLTIFNTLNHLK